MCGIAGILGNSSPGTIEAMVDSMRARGPDDRGVFAAPEEGICLGHRRLSIIDLSARGHQPMKSRCGRYTIVFNGEIYNYQKLRTALVAQGAEFQTHTDTEVILEGYSRWREGVLSRLRGMFAFGIWDHQESTLVLARDRFGIKPLLYARTGKHLLFASELAAFGASGLLPMELDPDAVADYFRFGAVQQPATIYKGIASLPPGHYIRVSETSVSEPCRYYDLMSEVAKSPFTGSYEDAVRLVRERLEEAAAYHLVADVEVGAFLSGGVDSSAVVALMKQHTGQPINTFSVGFSSRTEVVDELSIAAKTARAFGTRHHEVILDGAHVASIYNKFVESIDQPSVDGINTYIVSQAAAPHVKVALSGLGGDEIFAGYSHFKRIPKLTRHPSGILSKMALAVHKIRPNRITFPYICNGVSIEDAVARIRSDGRTECMPGQADFSRFSDIQRISRAEIEGYLLDTLLRDCDVLSMAHSLEVRPILLDHRLVELALSLPDHYKMDGQRYKKVFVDAVKDIIPADTWQRSKSGFSMPLATWMNGPLHDRVMDVSAGHAGNGYVDSRLLKGFMRRASTRRNITVDWRVFLFLSWLGKI